MQVWLNCGSQIMQFNKHETAELLFLFFCTTALKKGAASHHDHKTVQLFRFLNDFHQKIWMAFEECAWGWGVIPGDFPGDPLQARSLMSPLRAL